MAKVLFVEDDKDLAASCRTKFSNHGFDVDVAFDGEEGLRLALKVQHDLIVLDIGIPKLDGLKVMEKLRETDWGKTARIILLTNMEPDGEILNAILKYNPTYYLVKANTNIDELLEKAKELLRDRS